MVGISLRCSDRLWCRSRPLMFGILKSATRQPVRFRSGEPKNSSAEANTSAANPIERINLLIASRTDSSSSTMATILLFFCTWKPRNRASSAHRTTDGCWDCNPDASVAPLYARIEVPLMAASRRECRNGARIRPAAYAGAQSCGTGIGRLRPLSPTRQFRYARHQFSRL
jgi:hypothetical protein